MKNVVETEGGGPGAEIAAEVMTVFGPLAESKHLAAPDKDPCGAPLHRILAGSFRSTCSRLYRNEFLYPNTHFAAFFKIYQIF